MRTAEAQSTQRNAEKSFCDPLRQKKKPLRLLCVLCVDAFALFLTSPLPESLSAPIIPWPLYFFPVYCMPYSGFCKTSLIEDAADS